MAIIDVIHKVNPAVSEPVVSFSIRKIMENARLERVQIDTIVLADNYPFESHEDFAMHDLIEEIRDNGVINPVLLRSVGDGYEIIDGRARYLAAKEVGETALDAKIIECTDDEARKLIAYSLKLFQRSFRDMPLTQQARMIAKYYNSIKRRGKRNDLIERKKIGEQVMVYDLLDEYNESRGGGLKYEANKNNGRKWRRQDVRTEAAARYGLSGRNLARYLRIDQMQDCLKGYIDDEVISFTAAVELSFLNERQQKWIAEAITDGAKINVRNAGKLKQIHTRQRKNPESEEFLNRYRLRLVLGLKPPIETAKTREALPPEIGATDETIQENQYERIDIFEYRKTRFPNFFPEDLDSLSADDRLISRLINFYVRIKDSLCALYPKRFVPEISDVDMLRLLYRAGVLFFSGLEDGSIKVLPMFGL